MTNAKEGIPATVDTNVYNLVTELSKHISQSYGQPIRRNAETLYDRDIKSVKRLRSKAFEILLKKANSVVDGEECKGTDPVLEIQKHAFALKLGSKRTHDATVLELLLQELEEPLFLNTSIYSVLQLLVYLKNFNSTPEPIANIFYYGKRNPAVPEMMHTSNSIQAFQIYPMECFILSDKFQATLNAQNFQIMHGMCTHAVNETNFLYGTAKMKDIGETEPADVSSLLPGVMSTHMFDTESSCTVISLNQYFRKTRGLESQVFQGDTFNRKTEESNCTVYWDKNLATNYLHHPTGVHTEPIAVGSESIIDTLKSSDYSVVREVDCCTADTWNRACSQIDIANILAPDYQTWECFGEIHSIKELMFMSDAPTAAIHLERIKEMSSLPFLSEKAINSVPLLKELSIEVFLQHLKLMLLGIESNSFEYKRTTEFTLRKNVSVYGVCSESLDETCQEAVDWGNCFKFLSDLVGPKSGNDGLLQEGLIFKALCTNIKELLLYYRASLLRIFTREEKSDGLLKILEHVRPIATLIVKVAKLCEPYKESQCLLREGNSILTRIYNEAIKVTDTKVALVFYSLLKCCCEVYFRFLQKWMFEGICEDIYGEFMIKTRPQYLRNRGHKFWTKSFSICDEAVPGFLIDLAESILQCGKTVKLLRICDSKNPVCHICVTEQPEVKVCLSVTTLHEQSLRCKDYERKGVSALGSVHTLSTAIQSQKQMEKEMTELVNRAHRDTLLRIQNEREDALKKVVQTKRDLLTCLKDQISARNIQQRKEMEDELTCETDRDKQRNIMTRSSSVLGERIRTLNRNEDLTNDIQKRYEWHAKRVAVHDKRIGALISADQDSEDETSIEKEGSRSAARLIIDNPASFEDENKNYTSVPDDRSLSEIVCDALTESGIEIHQRRLNRNERTLLAPFAQKNSNNNNESNDFGSNQNRSVSAVNNIGNNNQLCGASVDTNRESGDALQDQLIERPTFLNVCEIGSTTIDEQLDKDWAQTLQYDMTPNNNELDVQRIRFTASINDVRRTVEDLTNVQQRNLETPMSCTTDHFTSSIHSPNSQTQNTEDRSPIEMSTTDVSSSYAVIARSPTPIKGEATFSDLFVLTRNERNVTTPATEASLLTVADVEIIDHTSLHAYLEKSIVIPLTVQSRLVNNAIIKFFLEENSLLLHLHSLRSYFFLLNGEFAKSLTDSLYARLYGICIPIELFNSATLTSLLERALINSFNNVFANSELLSLSATDTPTHLHISDPSALDCLSLNYKINWPLNIILDDTVMQQYGKVFKFLITSGRVSWVLQEDFNLMKRERKAATSEQYHKLQLYRHSMTQFMNALHNYLTCSVLHASWAEFEKDLENSLTVDQIYLSHVNYLRRILSRCMLTARGEKIRVCLNNIFKVILKFHNRLRFQDWTMKSTGYVHPNFKRLEQMYRAFSELRAYMAHVAFKLAISGYQPHLMHFLNALNINRAYDLTVRTHRGDVPSKL